MSFVYVGATNSFTSISLDSASGVFSGTPLLSDISISPVTLTFKTQDNHASTGFSADFNQIVNILDNPAPTNTSTISDQTYTVGEAISFSFPDTLFTDIYDTIDDYSFSSVPDASSWLTLDASTRTFSGMATSNTHSDNITVTLYAHDSNNNSAHGTTLFNIEMLPNQPPVVDQGLHASVTNVSVHHQFVYTVPSDAFSDPENNPIVITSVLSPNDFVLTYNITDMTLTGTPSDNTKFGVYNATLSVGDTYNSNALTVNLTFEVYENMPPSIDATISDQPCQPAYSLFSYGVEKALLTEPENEAWTLHYFIIGPTGIGWFGSSQNSTHIIYSGTPNNTEYANFTVTLTLDDGNSDVANDTATFNI